MKTSIKLFTILLFSGFILGSCSSDDTHDIDDDIIVLACDNSPQTLFALQADGVYSYNINNLDSSQPSFLGQSPASDWLHELPTNNSIYSETENLHGLLVSRPGKYFTFNTDTGLGAEFDVPTDISAPIMLNNSTYTIEVSNSGYANHGLGNHYEIRSFDIHTGDLGATLPIDTAEKTFENNSFFHVESMSSATNGVDEIYFISGPNLITVNTTNNTASHLNLYPNFTFENYTRFIGLEYSDDLGLIAIVDTQNNTIMEKNLVQINTTTGDYSVLLPINFDINTEYYSTAFRECDQTYYLTALNSANVSVYYEFDLINNLESHSQNFSSYAFGIELIP